MPGKEPFLSEMPDLHLPSVSSYRISLSNQTCTSGRGAARTHGSGHNKDPRVVGGKRAMVNKGPMFILGGGVSRWVNQCSDQHRVPASISAFSSMPPWEATALPTLVSPPAFPPNYENQWWTQEPPIILWMQTPSSVVPVLGST